MINVSLRLGALVARASAEQLSALDTYGSKLGLAFQIVDDLLDLRRQGSADGETTGKGRRPRQADVPGRVGGGGESAAGPSAGRRGLRRLGTLPGASAAALEALARYVIHTKPVNAMHQLLSNIQSPETLRNMSLAELKQLADEIRDVLCNLLSTRSAHFASNLGVVELCLALHSVFDFQPRPADLGHGPSDLSAQAGHRAVPRIRHDPHQGGPDGIPQSRREPLRPVHDRACRLEHFHVAGSARRRRTAAGRPIAMPWP